MPAIRSRRALTTVAAATVAVAGSAFGLTTGAPATAAPATGPASAISPRPVLHLRGGDVVVGAANRSAAAGLAPRALGAKEAGAYVVQLDAPITTEQRTAVQAKGARILGYLPDFAYSVRMTSASADAVRTLPGVVAVERVAPSWRLAPAARTAMAAGKAGVYSVRLTADVDPAAGRQALAATGAVVTGEGRSLVVAASAAQLKAIAVRDEVADVQVWELPTTSVAAQSVPQAGAMPRNDVARSVLRADIANGRGYDGSSQVAAVADTGLGTGDPATAFRDLPASRIVAIKDWPTQPRPNCMTPDNDGARDVDSGHGTHTAVSVAGGGDAKGVGKAPAPAVKLVFQAVEDWADTTGNCALVTKSGYLLAGIPNDIGALLQQAYDLGARVHSDSWGSNQLGVYNDQAVEVDTWSNAHRDMLTVFAAGNSAKDGDGDGVIDDDSVGAPATAKNILAVGAGENSRTDHPCDTSLTYPAGSTKERDTVGASCAAVNGQQKVPTWGAWWPQSYPAAPVSTDVQDGNAEQVAPFSGRGPTDDGRIKPDVVAPGSWILSGYSPLFQQGYSSTPNPKNGAYQYDGYGFPYDNAYKYMSGTSMATPLAASGAVVVRDFYTKKWGVSASAALVKATLINSAHDELDENQDGANDNDLPIPNVHEGWGRIDLDAATTGDAKFVDEGAGLTTGATSERTIDVTAGQPLRVSAVWTDAPAAANAAVTLVNDLDLEVVSPDGTVYRGNAFSGGWSTTGGTADRRNNVENVYVAAPRAGTWTVRVKGYNVPVGSQSYALVMSGGVGGGGTSNHNPVVTEPGRRIATPGQPFSLALKATDVDGDTLTWSATGLPAGLVIDPRTGVISGIPTASGDAPVTVRVSDGKGGEAQIVFTISVGWTTSANLLANPGFEQGATGWAGTTSGIGAGPAHEGTNRAVLAADGESLTSSAVTIPSTASSPKAWAWVNVDSTDGTYRAYDSLKAEVIDEGGAVVATMETLTNMDQKKGWRQISADLSAAKGKTVRLRFTTTQDGPLPTTFTIDDTAITATTSTGGTTPTPTPTPTPTVTSTSTPTPTPTVTPTSTPTVTPTVTPTPTTTATPAPRQLITNPGFESGSTGWTGTAGAITTNAGRPARTGSWKLWLGGNGYASTESAQQVVTVPADASSATLTYWVRVDTAERAGSERDRFELRVVPAGASSVVVDRLTNLDATGRYVQRTVNLSAYRGKTLALAFVAVEDSARQTSFVVDDVELAVR